ncbi:MAG: NTP transferase domain-containing protein, partial [Candidatus Eisenbacteria bacterium]|nr:NTP transferase domain-containing protein [Candidatus Eisenbacteria bacterium]
MRRAGTKGNERVSGFVLAGGASRRFGSNKALATHRGRSLLALALRAMRELNIHPRIVAPDPAPFRRYRAPVLTGERPGLGPVEGVRVALTHAA